MVKQHAENLETILNKYHNITEDWEGKKYAGIDLKWDYEKITCRATMDRYILDLKKISTRATLKTPIFTTQTPPH